MSNESSSHRPTDDDRPGGGADGETAPPSLPTQRLAGPTPPLSGDETLPSKRGQSASLASAVTAPQAARWSDPNDITATMPATDSAMASGTAASSLRVAPRRLGSPGQFDNDQGGDYELLNILGRGGMGVVYEARQTAIDRSVAIKMMRGVPPVDEQVRTRFLGEAAVTGDLEHPNIVPIYDLGCDQQGDLFYVMRKIQGQPWSQVIRARSRSENLEILLRVADAVAFAHSKGIIHRDLKPANIMLGSFGEVLVVDWGLAVAAGTSARAAQLTEETARGGTPAYMAPEMARADHQRIGFASDVYLLGAILFEILTGKRPHAGATVSECLRHAANNVVVETEVSGELMSIARRAMATEPAQRFTDVATFQAAIRSFMNHQESYALVDHGRQLHVAAQNNGDYEVFSRCVYAFEEARSLWPENPDVGAALQAVQGDYAQAAHAKGDYELALSVLKTSDGHQQLRSQISVDIQRRSRRQALQRRLVGIMLLLGAVIVVGSVVAALAIAQAQQRTQAALVEVTHERDRAELEGRRVERVAELLVQSLGTLDPGQSGQDARVIDAMARAATQLPQLDEEDPAVSARLHGVVAATYESLTEYALASHHYARSIALMEANADADTAALMEARRRLGRTHLTHGRIAQAKPLLRNVYDYYVQGFADDHGQRLRAEAAWAYYLYRSNRYQDAIDLLQRILPIQRAVFGPQSQAVYDTINLLSIIYGMQGTGDLQEEYLRQSLELALSQHGEDHPRVRTHWVELGHLQAERGEFQQALYILDEHLKELSRFYGVHSQFIIELHKRRAQYLEELGQHRQGRLILEDLLATHRQRLGDADPIVLGIMNDLAVNYRATGERDQSGAMLEHIVQWADDSGDEYTFSLPYTLHTLAGLRQEQRRFDQAEDAYRRAITLHQRRGSLQSHTAQLSVRRLGELLHRQDRYDDMREIATMAWQANRDDQGQLLPGARHIALLLGVSLRHLGELDESQQRLEEAVDAFITHDGEQHEETLNAINSLAVLYARRGDYGQALSWGERAWAGWQARNQADDWRAQAVLDLINRMRRHLGEQEKTATGTDQSPSDHNGASDADNAEDAHRHAIAQHQRRGTMQSTAGQRAVTDLCAILYAAGRYQDLEQVARVGWEANHDEQGQLVPEARTIAFYLAVSLRHLDQLDEALERFHEVVDLHIAHDGEHDPNTLNVMNSLAVVYGTREEYQEALVWSQRAWAGWQARGQADSRRAQNIKGLIEQLQTLLREQEAANRKEP